MTTRRDSIPGTGSRSPKPGADAPTSGNLTTIDSWTNEWFERDAGGSAHEVRTWIAAHSSLAAFGPDTVRSRFYRAIPEWIAGFAVTTAELA